jgi:hypothetical protein
MANEPHTPEAGDGPVNPFADLQAEIEGIDLIAENATATGMPAAPRVDTPSDAAEGVPAKKGVPRLCPGCNTVSEFVDSRCVSCGYQIGAQTPHGEEAVYTIAEAYPEPRSPLIKVAAVLLVLVLLGIAGWFAWPQLQGEERKATDASTDLEGAKTRAEAEDAAKAAPALAAVKVDEALHARIASAVRVGNDAWHGQGVKAYVYRYSVRDHTGADLQQQLRIVGFVGGADVGSAVTDPRDDLFYTAIQGLLEELNSNSGVTATFDLLPGDQEEPAPGDKYTIYGRDYGQDHMEDIKPLIDAIENYKNMEGQYPIALDGTVIQGIKTKGNPNFVANGYGYLPVFRTDSAGNVVMGTGAGVAKLKPAEVTGYYLFAFLSDPTQGLDIYSAADLHYYTNKISPFPYRPQGHVRNMPMTKDGKPDGIAAVLKTGKLQ